MTLEELARGANRGEGPDLSRSLRVTSAKSAGRSLGFTAKDARGDLYFIKLDPAACPQLTTSTGVIGARFFHAFGYHVPEDYLLIVRPPEVIADPESEEPEKVQMMIKKLLELAAGRPDGSLQFKNLGADSEVGTVTGYRFQWFSFDNDQRQLKPRGRELVSRPPSIPLPPSDVRGHLMVRIKTESPDQTSWSSPVDVYVRNGSEIVGLERHILDEAGKR